MQGLAALNRVKDEGRGSRENENAHPSTAEKGAAMSKRMSLRTKLAAGAAATMSVALLGACLLSSAPAEAAGAGTPATPAAAPVTAARTYLAQGTGNGACAGLIDENGDGFCDACGAAPRANHHGCRAFCDADGDGACDTCARPAPNGSSGVVALTAPAPSAGTAAPVQGPCGTCGRAYVDATGDGVCDACARGSYHSGHRAHHGATGNAGTRGYGRRHGRCA